MTDIKNKNLIDFINFPFSDEVQNKIYFVLKKILEIHNIPLATEVTISCVTPEEIKELNNEYRNIDKTTDVLSFPIFNNVNEILNSNSNVFLMGDVILNLEQAEIQAHEIGNTLEEEIIYLTIHSLLHLLGYDHININDKTEMRNLEKEVLNSLKEEYGQ